MKEVCVCVFQYFSVSVLQHGQFQDHKISQKRQKKEINKEKK